MGGTYSTDSPVWKRTLKGRSYKWWAMSRGCFYSYFSRDKICREEIKQYLNRMKKKITEEQVIKIYWKLIGLQSLGTGCPWIAGWWDLEGVLGKAHLVFYFLYYFCKHLLLDTVGQRKRQASKLIFISLVGVFTDYGQTLTSFVGSAQRRVGWPCTFK